MKIKGTILYAVEFSVVQNCFHLQPLIDSIKDNLESCMQSQSNDYTVIGVFEDEEKATEYIDKLRPILVKKRPLKKIN